MKEFKAEEIDAGQRADVFLVSKYPDFTRSSLELLFDRGLVSINGKPAKAAQKIKAGDKLEVDESPLKSEPPQIDLPIIHEDKNVVVIDKPAGILTHSKGALNLEGTVASFIKPRLNDKSLSGNRAGIVHRLDRATSGVIITAKNSQAMSRLQKQFSKRKAKKQYVAVVEGRLQPAEAIIDAPIGRNPSRPQTFRVMSSGKPAITEYHVLKTFQKNDQTYSLVELKPQTGRTHQLRVHLAYVGHPIVGDGIYGHENGVGLLLHAKSLEITLPDSERRVFESEPPANIKEFSDV